MDESRVSAAPEGSSQHYASRGHCGDPNIARRRRRRNFFQGVGLRPIYLLRTVILAGVVAKTFVNAISQSPFPWSACASFLAFRECFWSSGRKRVFLQAHVIYEVIALPEGVARVADEFWLHAQIGCADGIIREVPLNRAEMRPLSEGWQLGQHSARAGC